MESEGEATTDNLSSQYWLRLFGSFHFGKALFYRLGFSLNLFQVFFQPGNSLIHLLNHHIHREDHVFYPMVREALSPSEMTAITELFQTEDRKAGPEALQTSRGLVRQMASLL